MKTDNFIYAKYLLEHNEIRKSEEDYYRGLTGRNPHGISDNIWKKAVEEVGIRIKK